jgi:protein tyrosine phosphatase
MLPQVLALIFDIGYINTVLCALPQVLLQEVCHQYWPLDQKSSETYGRYFVTLNKQEISGDYVIRKLDITDSQSRSVAPGGAASFTVTQLQYTRWPADGVPQSTTGILEVANLVQKVQMSSGNKAIVVMCK